MMNLQQAISEIINAIPTDFYFDSHFIIEQLIKNYSDEYIRFVSIYSGSSDPTLTAHSQLGHEISRNLSIQQAGKSISSNIHQNISECTLFKKL